MFTIFFYFGAIAILIVSPGIILTWFIHVLRCGTECLRPWHLHNIVRKMFSIFKAAGDDTFDDPHT